VKPIRSLLVLGSALLALSLTISGQTLADGARKPAVQKRVVPTKSIRVGAQTVLCIAESGIQPSAKPVPHKGKRPAGIAVFGVGALGLGVADGDVLSEVLGQPVKSQAQVVAMVIAARSRNMSEISGILWHGTQAFSVTVEQPYDVPNCSADEPSCWRSRCGREDQRSQGSAEKNAQKR